MPPSYFLLVQRFAARSCTMPNGKGRRRRFGAIRRLPSGRYQPLSRP
jgi:hypothetical protein